MRNLENVLEMMTRNFLILLTLLTATAFAQDVQNGSTATLQQGSAPTAKPQVTAETPANKIDRNCPLTLDGYTINFENIGIIELIRFISKISDVNFVFNQDELCGIKITIVSEAVATVQDLLDTLMQVLRMRGFSVSEQGKNIIINSTQNLGKISTVVSDTDVAKACGTAVITRVFRMYNLAPEKVSTVIRPLLSKDAIVEVVSETMHLIVSDLTANIEKVADLLVVLDTPNSSLDIGEYQVANASPQVITTYAKEILAPLMQDNPIQMIPQISTNRVYIVGTPYLIHKATQVLQSLDVADVMDVANLPPTAIQNNVFYVYKLKFMNGDDIARSIQAIGTNLQYNGVGNVDLISAIYSIQWVEVTNSLIISGTVDAVEKVKKLIDDLDASPAQVYIEILIIDTTIGNALNFGVEWIALANQQQKLAFASGLLDTPPSTAPFGSNGVQQPLLFQGARNALNSPPPNAARGGGPGTGGDIPLSAGFGFGIVGNIIRHGGESFLTLGSLINALQTETDTVIVQNPRIMAQDEREANFFVGSNIPYQTTNTIIRDTGSVTQNIQYEDIGVQLRVTPQVGPNNIVTLEIDQALSDIVDNTATVSTVGGSTLLLAPTTSKTLASTRVHVPSGCYLVMSGHIRDEKRYTKQGIPCLGSLPWVGAAFSSTSEIRQKRNLIMFIQPHVVHTSADGARLSSDEGYDYNWGSNPFSIVECDTVPAPENIVCPPAPPSAASTNNLQRDLGQ